MTHAQIPSSARGLQQLVAIAQPRSPAAEAYRTLMTNIRFSSIERPLRTILFTSPDPDEGKSTTLANLAVTAAQGGTHAVLVDGDLRRPRLHEIFDLPNEDGLATALALESCTDIPAQQTFLSGLTVLTSGPPPPSPADLLSSARLVRILDALKDSADLVMLDSPPVTAVADASILAPRVDAVVLVLDAMRTRREQAQRAKAQLERVNAHILGVVLNNARIDKRSYRY